MEKLISVINYINPVHLNDKSFARRLGEFMCTKYLVGGGLVQLRYAGPRGQLIISWFLLRTSSSTILEHKLKRVSHTRLYFIDTYDGTLSGWSCFKPQRELTEKRHTLQCLLRFDEGNPHSSQFTFNSELIKQVLITCYGAAIAWNTLKRNHFPPKILLKVTYLLWIRNTCIWVNPSQITQAIMVKNLFSVNTFRNGSLDYFRKHVFFFALEVGVFRILNFFFKRTKVDFSFSDNFLCER